MFCINGVLNQSKTSKSKQFTIDKARKKISEGTIRKWFRYSGHNNEIQQQTVENFPTTKMNNINFDNDVVMSERLINQEIILSWIFRKTRRTWQYSDFDLAISSEFNA